MHLCGGLSLETVGLFTFSKDLIQHWGWETERGGCEPLFAHPGFETERGGWEPLFAHPSCKKKPVLEPVSKHNVSILKWTQSYCLEPCYMYYIVLRVCLHLFSVRFLKLVEYLSLRVSSLFHFIFNKLTLTYSGGWGGKLNKFSSCTDSVPSLHSLNRMTGGCGRSAQVSQELYVFAHA